MTLFNTIKLNIEWAKDILAAIPPDHSAHSKLAASIQVGEQENKIALERYEKAEAARKAEKLAQPISERGTDQECGEEFNRLRRLYNFSWEHEFDLTSMGGLIITAYSGQWVGTSGTQSPRDLLKIAEHGVTSGLFGEPFVGPLYEHSDEDDE